MRARHDSRVLDRLLLEARRAVDDQLAASRHHDATAGLLTSLAIGLLAAASGALLLVSDRAGASSAFLTGLGVAGAQNVAALVLVVESFVGFPRHVELYSSLDPRALQSFREETSTTYKRLQTAILSAYAGFFDENKKLLASASKALHRSLLFLLSGALTYAAVLLFIPGGPIHG